MHIKVIAAEVPEYATQFDTRRCLAAFAAKLGTCGRRGLFRPGSVAAQQAFVLMWRALAEPVAQVAEDGDCEDAGRGGHFLFGGSETGLPGLSRCQISASPREILH